MSGQGGGALTLSENELVALDELGEGVLLELDNIGLISREGGGGSGQKTESDALAMHLEPYWKLVRAWGKRWGDVAAS